MKRRIAPVLVLFFFTFLFSCFSRNALLREHFQDLKRKEEIVVVIFGDTISGGESLSGIGESYGRKLKQMLKVLFGKEVSLINTSRPDETYRFGYRRIQEDILSYRPDIVFVALGLMDAFSPGILLSTHQKNIKKFYQELKESGTFVIVLTITGFKDLELQNDPRLNRIEDFNNLLREQARYFHYPVIDITRCMKGVLISRTDEYRSFYSDLMRLSPKGEKFVADCIYNRITHILGETF